jgi:predicted metal-binding protein
MKLKTREVNSHLFICTRARDDSNKVSCSASGALQIVRALKDRLKENQLNQSIKVTSCGCLGPCADGINAVLYPDNILISHISSDDIDSLYSLITKPRKAF